MTVLLFVTRAKFEQRKAFKRHIAYLKTAEQWRLDAINNCKMIDVKFCYLSSSREELIFDKHNFFLVKEELLRRSAAD